MSTAEAVALASSRVAAAAPPAPPRPEVKHNIPPTLPMSMPVYTNVYASTGASGPVFNKANHRQAAMASVAGADAEDSYELRYHSSPRKYQSGAAMGGAADSGAQRSLASGAGGGGSGGGGAPPRRRRGKGSPRRLQQDTTAHIQPVDTASVISGVSSAHGGAGQPAHRRHVASKARLPGATGGIRQQAAFAVNL